MSRKKNLKQLILAIVIGIVIAAIAYQFIMKLKLENDNLKKQATEVQNEAAVPTAHKYITFKRDIKAGEEIKSDDIVEKDFPIAIDGALTKSYDTQNLVAKQDIKADLPILNSYFSKVEIQEDIQPLEGFRAISMVVPKTNYYPYMTQNSFVDIYFPKSKLIATSILILSLKDSSDKKSKVMMMQIKNEDVPTFITAITEDKPYFIQKNSEEIMEYKIASTIPQVKTVNEEEMKLIKEAQLQNAQLQQELENLRKNKSARTIEFIAGDKKTLVGAPL